MKKLILTLAIVLGVATVSAQDAKMWVGGTVGLWSSKVKGGDSELSFKIMPEVGYIINDNLAVGISLGAGHTHNLSVSDDAVGASLNFEGNTAASQFSANVYKINPFVRYSFLKGAMGAMFVDGGVGYQLTKYCATGSDGKEDQIEVGFRPGLAINVSDKVALIGKFGFLGYQHNNYKMYDTKSDNFGFDFDLDNLQLGISVKF